MDEIKSTNLFELLIFIYLTMLISGASSIAGNDFVKVVACCILFIYCLIKNKPLINKPLFYLIIGWILINIISSIHFSKSIEIYQFLGKIILVYTSYLILVCNKKEFWSKYENFLYKLVIISFLIYIFSLIIPSVFDNFSPFFRSFTSDNFYLKETQRNYFYSFFFVYKGGSSLFRNNGFMWEPGAFAMILNLLIAYNIVKYGIKFNKHIIVYIVALLTTFSTAGYLSLFVLLILFFVKGQNLYVKFGILLCLIASIIWIINADFLLPKIKMFMESTTKGQVSHQGYRDLYEANRILSFKLLLDKFLMFPIGWGCIQDSTSYMAINKIATVNGLGNTLVTWGIFAFSFFMYSIVKFLYQYCRSIKISLILFVAIAILFFSNPIENNILLYILVISPYVIVGGDNKTEWKN